MCLGNDLPPTSNVCSSASLSHSSGRIHSPGFPNDYKDYLQCNVTILVPPQKAVEIVYNYYDIERKFIIFA